MEIIFDDDLLGDQNGQTPFHTRFPQDLRNSSPSRTLIIRRAISAVLVPTWLFIDAVVSVVGETVMFVVKDFLFLLTLLGFYVVLVLACWKRAGSPPFWAWARSFWLTARVAAVLEPKLTERDDVKLRGNGKDSDGSGSEGEDGRVKDGDGPKPLTSVWAFFRSSSPLDDLLVTFEITRGLVQPLNWTQGRRRLGDEEAPIDSGPSVQTENGQGVSKSKYTATDTTESGEKC